MDTILEALDAGVAVFCQTPAAPLDAGASEASAR